MKLAKLFIDKKNPLFNELKVYNGSQLRPLFSYEKMGLKGSSILSWISPCQVHLDHMVDYEDKVENAIIASDEMLHFMIEIFKPDLTMGVCFQRLIGSIVFQYLLKKNEKLNSKNFFQSGDDLYFLDNNEKRKLSISICSVSSVSTQIHFAMNTINSGTPVPTISLSDFHLENFELLANDLMSLISDEWESISEATMKVKPLY